SVVGSGGRAITACPHVVMGRQRQEVGRGSGTPQCRQAAHNNHARSILEPGSTNDRRSFSGGPIGRLTRSPCASFFPPLGCCLFRCKIIPIVRGFNYVADPSRELRDQAATILGG
ncbi:hypothetical protein NDU88_009470, partial [Pleurodeles waltl]